MHTTITIYFEMEIDPVEGFFAADTLFSVGDAADEF